MKPPVPSHLCQFSLFPIARFREWETTGSIRPSITVTQSSVMTPLPTGTSPVGARTCLIHTHLFAQEFSPIKALNRRLGLTLLKHFYKTKPFGLPSELVFDHSC